MMLAVLILGIGCDKANYSEIETDITAEVDKIEISYYNGCDKEETVYVEGAEKIVTEASSELRNKTI